MVYSNRGFFLVATCTSAVASILSIVSLSTQEWVVGKGEFTVPEVYNEQLSIIKYGLFSGTFLENLGGSRYYTLYATCLYQKNVCAYLCTSTSERRETELKKLYRNEVVEFSCPSVIRLKNEINMSLGYAGIIEHTRMFINAGAHISTIVCLSISAVFGVISTILSMLNTAKIVRTHVFGIRGIFIYNVIACIGTILTLLLWGALFGTTIIRNIGILYTIQGQMNTDGWTNLGLSYWLNLPSCLLYTASIFILFLRYFFVSEDSKEDRKDTANDNAASRRLMIS